MVKQPTPWQCDGSIQAYQEATVAHILVEFTGSCAWDTTAKEGGESMTKRNFSVLERLAQQLDDRLAW